MISQYESETGYGGTCYVHWESLSELNGELVPELNRDLFREVVVDRRQYDSRSWFGVAGGWEKVQELVAGGWVEGMERGEELVAKVKLPTLPSVRRVRTRRDFGDHLDIHRVYAGDLSTAWTSSRRVAPPMAMGQNISVILDMTASCIQSADALFWNGATAFAIMKALVASGRSVQLLAKTKCHQSSAAVVASIVLKDYAQPIDSSKLFACTALAGFFRGFGFKMINMAPVKTSSSYGSIDHSREISPLWKKSTRAIFVDGCFTKEKAQEALNNIEGLLQEKSRKVVAYG